MIAVFVPALIVCLSLSGCNVSSFVQGDTVHVPPVGRQTEQSGYTAGPSDPTAAPEDSFPVSPVPGSPKDPLDPGSYPENAELDALVSQIISAYGGSLENIYDFVNNKVSDGGYGLSYDYGDKLTLLPGYDELALHILKTGHGVCYHYAALTYYLLRAAGFDACIIYGYRVSDEALHYWTMVKTPEGWYHFDPLHRQMLLTDAEKSSDEATRGNGLSWEQGIWPATPAALGG